MNQQQPPDARDGAFLALTLAGALKLGLPDPDYITMSPRHARGEFTSAVDFQFNDGQGQDPLPRLYAWAERLGADVRVSAEPKSTWHKFDFTHSGVRFHAYAKIEDDAPSVASDEAAAVPAEPIACAACGQPRFAHHHGELGSIPGLCDAYDPGDPDAAAPEVCGLPTWGDEQRLCPLFAGHEPLPGCPGDGERVSLRIAGGAA